MHATDLLQSASIKAKQLIDQHRQLKNELASVHKQLEHAKAEVQHLTASGASLAEENRILKEQIKTIKLAQSLTNGSGDQGSRQVKTKINEYIREIDKCLSLLNRE